MSPGRGAMTRWMFEEYRIGERSLAVSRVLTALYLLVMAYPRYVGLAAFPSSFYAPALGLGAFFRDLPPAWVLWLLLGASVSPTLALLVGWHTRASGLTLTALTVVGNSFEYAFGKIDHDILVLMVLLTMSFSGWGRRYSVDARRAASLPPVTGWPLAMLALLVGFGMFSAGLPKVLTGWLDPSTQSAQAHILYNYHVLERATLAGRLPSTTPRPSRGKGWTGRPSSSSCHFCPPRSLDGPCSQCVALRCSSTPASTLRWRSPSI